jgi:hypothetical protein
MEENIKLRNRLISSLDLTEIADSVADISKLRGEHPEIRTRADDEGLRDALGAHLIASLADIAESSGGAELPPHIKLKYLIYNSMRCYLADGNADAESFFDNPYRGHNLAEELPNHSFAPEPNGDIVFDDYGVLFDEQADLELRILLRTDDEEVFDGSFRYILEFMNIGTMPRVLLLLRENLVRQLFSRAQLNERLSDGDRRRLALYKYLDDPRTTARLFNAL